jgi:DnaK suppressor protein
MPAKKTASKARKKAASGRKKVAKRKPAAAKKSAASQRKTTKKKASRKKASGKKVAKKKVTKKKPAKKPTRKKSVKKKPAKKRAAKKKAVTRKKPATRKKVAKKAASRKKPAKKAAAKKATARKPSRKKVSKKKVSKKKVARKTAVSRKKTVAKPAARPAAPRRKKAPARKRGDILSGPIHGIEPYKPARGEEYMSPEQLEHFEAILLSWKNELMKEVDRTVHHMQDEAANFPDPSDRATQESEFGLELRTRDRERKLLRKITSALMRIEEGSYGFCDETGEEIGLKRLEARPVATLCLEAQERREMAERQYRDRDDRYR